MKNKYNKTMTACFTGYIVQAIVNNFVPLLFLTFQRSYDIPLSQITALVTFNFGVQLLVDLLSIGFVDKIGYRASMVIAHIMSAAGLLLLTVLPEVMPPFAGILISVMVYAIGGGLLEVLVSPVVESCPSDNKVCFIPFIAGAMWQWCCFLLFFSERQESKTGSCLLQYGRLFLL